MSPDASPEPERQRFVDDRRRDAQRYDAVCDQVIETHAQVREMSTLVMALIENIPKGQVQEVHYKTEGMGTLGVICAAVCALCVLFIVVESVRQESNAVKMEARIDGRLRDLEAWRGVHSTKIQNLESAREKK